METISRLFLTFLLNAIWQIPLITMIAFFCDRLLLKTSARIRHVFWVAALILSFSLPFFSGFDFSSSIFLRSQTSQIINIQPSFDPGSGRVVLEMPPSEANSVISINKSLFVGLLTFYFIFLVYRSIKLLKAWKETQNIRHSAFSITPLENISTIIENVKMTFGVKKARILYSSIITSPITVGAFDPIIIMPEALSEETDQYILLSAIGHELVHVRRCDYLLNLLYEVIYLPLSFHPVATLVKRRIKETRELSCDELVIDKLLEPKVYASSLVQLAGSALDLGRRTNITIGINDADILENRIMRILKRPKITVYQRNLSLILTSLLFVAAFIVATTFILRPVVAQQSTKQEPTLEEKRKAEKEAKAQEIKKTLDEKQKIELDYVQGHPIEDRVITQKMEAAMMAKNLADFAKQSKITMTEAIAIATKQQPGTVLEGRLTFVKVGDVNQAFYAIRIAFGERDEKVIFINANNGEIRPPFKLVLDSPKPDK